MLNKAVQAAIYEKALKNHYIEILYIDFEDTGKCKKLHQDTKLVDGENIFPESDEQMFDDYICDKIMRYAVGDVQDLNQVKKQMTTEAIVQGTAEHIIHHVMINFMLNGEMRFMQFDFTRESTDTKNVFLFVEDYTDPQQQAFITTLRSIQNSAVLFCVLSEEEDARTTLCYDPVFITRGFAEVMETTQQQMMTLQKKPFCETVHPDDQQYVVDSVRSLSIDNLHTNIFYRKKNPQGKWFYMQSDLSYLIVGKKKYIYVTYQDVSALQKNEELSNALRYTKKCDEELTKEEPLQQMERENRYSGKKVLIVEDNELNREIATALLEEIGISVDFVEDGTDAVERMNEVDDDRYDLIFMDIQMPKMDGYMATREIRTLKNNKKANIPIIAMTANAFEEDKKKAFQAGMNAHIAKPIDIKTILAAFDQVFGAT